MKAKIYLATMLSALCVFNGISYADFQPVQTLPGRLPSGSNVPIQTLPGRLPGGSNVPIQTLPGRLPGGSNVPIQTLPGRLPGGSNVPIHTLPGHLPNVPIQTLPAIRQTVHSRLGVLLIRDQVTGSDYVTTLDSSSNVTLPGSPPQAIFGARVRGQGARKVATWYTHRYESNVVRIEDFTPREAFVGMTTENGHSAGLSGDSFILTNGTQVNPVLSGKAFSELINMPMGSSHELGFTEVLRNGDRQFTTTVYKRAQLELGAASPQCKEATVEGISGKVCVLRTISGASTAQSGGDVMFSVEMRARLNASHARFRVGDAWHPLGQRVPVAEFAHAKKIELFFVPPAMTKVVQRLSDLAQMNFSSASRLGRGDRFDIRLRNNAELTPEKTQVLSHLNILTVRDKLSGKETLITLQGSEHQTLSSSDSSKWLPVWYLEAKGIQPLYPLVGIKEIKPTKWFSGIADRQGRLVAPNTFQGVYPVLSSIAIHSFSSSPIGTQQLFSAVGELNNGKNVTYLTNVKKQAYVVFDSPRIDCHKESLNGMLGRRCSLRNVDVEGAQFIPKDIMLTLKTKVPLSHALYFIGNFWHRIGEQVPLMSLAGNNNIDFFYIPGKAGFSFPNLMFSISHGGLDEEMSNLDLDKEGISSDVNSQSDRIYRVLLNGSFMIPYDQTFKFNLKLMPPLKSDANIGMKVALLDKNDVLLSNGSVTGEIKSVGSKQETSQSIGFSTNDQWADEKKIDAGADHYEISFKGNDVFEKAKYIKLTMGSGAFHIQNSSGITHISSDSLSKIKSFRPVKYTVVSKEPDAFVMTYDGKLTSNMSINFKMKATTSNTELPYKQDAEVSLDGGVTYKPFRLSLATWLSELKVPKGTESIIIKLTPNAAANVGDKFGIIVSTGAYGIPDTLSDQITFVGNVIDNVRGSTVIEGQPLTYHAVLANVVSSSTTLSIDIEPFKIKNVSYSKSVAVFNSKGGGKLGQVNVDLSKGLASLEIPVGTKSIDVSIPTIVDNINTNQDINFNIRSWLASGKYESALNAIMTLKNKEVPPTVSLSVTSSSPTAQSGEFAAGSDDIVFDYKVKADYTNMVPQSFDTLMLVASEQRIAYLVSRAVDALTMQIKVNGASLRKQGKQAMCVFTVSDGDDHAPVPSWLEYEQGGVGKWVKRRNDCSGSPLRIDDGYWQQTASDPAKGTKSMELNSRLRFVMNDGSSGFTLERNRFWAGNATGKGSISFELLFQNKAA